MIGLGAATCSRPCRPSASPTPSPDRSGHLVQQTKRCRGDAVWQFGQDSLCGLDEQNADVALRVDTIEAEGNHFTRGAMELSGQLRAPRAGADDRYVELTERTGPS